MLLLKKLLAVLLLLLLLLPHPLLHLHLLPLLLLSLLPHLLQPPQHLLREPTLPLRCPAPSWKSTAQLATR